jgi:hypothetical protein
MKLISALGTAAALGLVAAAPTAQAADWSIGIGIVVPGVTVVAPAPVYVPPPPRYYVPRIPPVYVVSPGYYGPYIPAPVYIPPPDCDHDHRWHRGWHRRHHDDDDDD